LNESLSEINTFSEDSLHIDYTLFVYNTSCGSIIVPMISAVILQSAMEIQKYTPVVRRHFIVSPTPFRCPVFLYQHYHLTSLTLPWNPVSRQRFLSPSAKYDIIGGFKENFIKFFKS